MYKLVQFDTVELPVARPLTRMPTAPTSSPIVATMGGIGYDAGGATLRPRLPYELVYEGMVYNATLATVRTAVDALRALRGKTADLTRQRVGSTEKHIATARLMAIEQVTEAVHGHGKFQPLTLRWLVTSGWRGTLRNDDLDEDVTVIDESPDTVVVANGGNVETYPVLSVKALGAPVTYLKLATGSCELEYTGSIAAGDWLVIDTDLAVMSVLNGANQDWNNLTLGANHATDAWFALAPGNNSITVDWVGGLLGLELNVKYYDMWA